MIEFGLIYCSTIYYAYITGAAYSWRVEKVLAMTFFLFEVFIGRSSDTCFWGRGVSQTLVSNSDPNGAIDAHPTILCIPLIIMKPIQEPYKLLFFGAFV